MRETAQGMHKAGIINLRRLREFEALYRANQVPQYTGKSVKELRSRLIDPANNIVPKRILL